MARRISIAAFLCAAALPALFTLIVLIDSQTGCPEGCGIFEGPLRVLGTVSYFGMLTATPFLFVVGVAALAIHTLRRA